MAITGTKQAERALWRSSRTCFEELAGHCQLRYLALRKDLYKSEDKERYIPDTSELRSESAKNIDRSCWLNISNGVTDPRHRRRNILPPATTDQALRAAHHGRPRA